MVVGLVFGTAWALVAGPAAEVTATEVPPGTGQVSPETDPPVRRRLAIGRLHNHIGLAAGVGLARREVEDATLAASTAVGGLCGVTF